MREAVGSVDIDSTCVRVKDDLMESEDSLEDNADVLVALGAGLTTHTTTRFAEQGDIHPDKSCYLVSRMKGVNAARRRRCCTWS
jgi:hypothetical protein